MDSKVLELKEALALITDWNQTYNAADSEGISRSGKKASAIAETLSEVNGTLASGWSEANHFCEKIFYAVQDILGNLYVEIDHFTDETYQNELAEQKAVEDANSLAGSILSELGLEGDSMPSLDSNSKRIYAFGLGDGTQGEGITVDPHGPENIEHYNSVGDIPVLYSSGK